MAATRKRKTKRKQAPDILKYDDYKKFLLDYYKYRKANSKEFSYRSFAQRTGVSYSYVRMVFSGERKLTRKMAGKFLKAIKLNSVGERHFYLLVDAQDKYDISYFSADKIKNINFSLVAALAYLKDFRPDPAWISMKCKGIMSERDAKKAIKDMLQVGILTVRNGKWTPEAKSMTKMSKEARAHQIDVTYKLLKKSKKSLSHCFFIPATQKSVEAVYRKMIEAFLSAAQEVPVGNEEVYNIAMSISPFAEVGKKSGYL